MIPRYEQVELRTARDHEGVVVFDGNVLVAVLARLSADHGDDAGRWSIEFLPGHEGERLPDPFADLPDAARWIEGGAGEA
ncbi:hypothetical protein [Sphingomonas endolithica]|uniref:hypothetical protein n=1 Tax=Sphingomonas endolithica TaxID=2972485 RepID=UPI0021AEF837|nr:hypothetical protein [Sphingomonas sp. ZFBP2030]